MTRMRTTLPILATAARVLHLLPVSRVPPLIYRALHIASLHARLSIIFYTRLALLALHRALTSSRANRVAAHHLTSLRACYLPCATYRRTARAVCRAPARDIACNALLPPRRQRHNAAAHNRIFIWRLLKRILYATQRAARYLRNAYIRTRRLLRNTPLPAARAATPAPLTTLLPARIFTSLPVYFSPVYYRDIRAYVLARTRRRVGVVAYKVK